MQKNYYVQKQTICLGMHLKTTQCEAVLMLHNIWSQTLEIQSFKS